MSARTAAKRNIPAAGGAGEGFMPVKPAELLLELLTLLLAAYGFLFSLVSCYGLEILTARTVITTLVFTLLAVFMYNSRRRRLLLILSIVLFELWFCLRMQVLVQGLLLLLKQALEPMALQLPPAFGAAMEPVETAEATKLATQCLQTLLFPVTMLSGLFIIRRPNLVGLAFVTLPLLLPGPFYTLEPSPLPVFCLLAAFMTLSVSGSGRFVPTTVTKGQRKPSLICRNAKNDMQKAARRMLAFFMLLLVVLAALISSWILPEASYERPAEVEILQEKLLSLDLMDLAGSNDGLTHGDLRNLTDIRYTGDTALKLRVSKERQLYLRDFAGVQFTGDSWLGENKALYQRYAAAFTAVAPINLHASAMDGELYSLSIQNIAAMQNSLFVPNGLVTRAEDIEGAKNAEDTALTAANRQGVAAYALEALDCKAYIDPVHLPTGGTETADIQSAYLAAVNIDDPAIAGVREAYIAYIFEAYTALPEDVRGAADALCESYGLSLQAGDALNIYATCYQLYQLFSERCSYTYSPLAIPESVDFVSHFLNESRSGYCVHFATAATVLLRALGIPARYAEGYIVVNKDYELPRDSDGYIALDDTHAHAWVEIYDPAQLEWIPFEMTPGTGSGTVAAPAETAAPTPTATPTPAPTPTPEPTPTPAPTDSPESSSAPEDAAAAEPMPSRTPEAGDSSAPPQTDGDGTGAPDAAPRAKELPRWLLPLMLPLIALFAAALILRSSLSARRKRLLLQPDANAAVLFAAQLCMKMLRAAGVPPWQALQTPEDFVTAAGQKHETLDSDALLHLVELAQRARFSGQDITRRERDEALHCLEEVFRACTKALPRPRRALLRLRFPPLQRNKD